MAAAGQPVIDNRPGGNGGSRPVPDPTELTDRAIAKALAAMTDYVDGKVAVIEERLNGIDKATALRIEHVINPLPQQMDEKVEALKDVIDERFASVAQRFTERDIRSEREARDNKVAVDAAFAAQKEAAAKQDEANAKAIDKSEKATAETIKTNLELTRSDRAADRRDIDETKGRVTVIESTKQGATENRTALYATAGIIGTILGILIAASTVIAILKP